MAVLSASWILDLALLLAGLLLALYLFYLKKFQHWKNLNVPHTSPSFPMGDIGKANNEKSTSEVYKDIYDATRGLKFVGMWSLYQPMLLVRDPELIKNIFVRDFMAFHDRGVYVNEEEDPLAAHLFSIEGTKWRNLRAKLSPTFTSGKMKMMFPCIVSCGGEMITLLAKSAKAGAVVEMRDISARFTTDVISLCAFGIQTNSLNDPDATFRQMGKKVIEPTLVNAIRNFLPFLTPGLARLIRLRTVTTDVTEFFMNAVKETMDYRIQNKVKRNDFMQLLIQLMTLGKLDDIDDSSESNKTEKDLKKITFEEAAAQAFVFFVAGFETSSTTMMFALYEMALNEDIQDRTRAEMQRVLAKHDGQLSYEAIYEMEYLGRVIDESLRKYPVVGVLLRESTRQYKIPDTEILLPRGQSIQVPVYGIHHDPDYYPQPEKFDPDRFMEEEKAKRHHYTYLPFGEGPRNCIGMRFGLMQIRVGLVMLLTNFRFEVSLDTPQPVVFDPKAFIFSPVGGMPLKITSVA